MNFRVPSKPKRKLRTLWREHRCEPGRETEIEPITGRALSPPTPARLSLKAMRTELAIPKRKRAGGRQIDPAIAAKSVGPVPVMNPRVWRDLYEFRPLADHLAPHPASVLGCRASARPVPSGVLLVRAGRRLVSALLWLPSAHASRMSLDRGERCV